MSTDLSERIRLGLGQLNEIILELQPLTGHASQRDLGIIETAAACAMLHSFYTEMEKTLSLIAKDWDGSPPASDAWHKELLHQMAASTDRRPAVITPQLASQMSIYLAFRHLFRGASIALMRWNKVAPLVADAANVHAQFVRELEKFLVFLGSC